MPRRKSRPPKWLKLSVIFIKHQNKLRMKAYRHFFYHFFPKVENKGRRIKALVLFNPIFRSVSHTTEDLIFEWDPDVPLVVDEYIELPQFDLVRNRTADCSQVYSTGIFSSSRDKCSILPPITYISLQVNSLVSRSFFILKDVWATIYFTLTCPHA